MVQQTHKSIDYESTVHHKPSDHEPEGITAVGITKEPKKASLAETVLTEFDHAAWTVKNPAHSSGGAVEIDPHLIAFMLPGIPESVPVARFHIRAALGFHQLGEYADNAETITSELVTNAIQHACGDGTEMIGVILMRIWRPDAVTVIVTDSSPQGPVKRMPSDSSGQGRGLLIVDELSACWGWNPKGNGKAVYAVLTKGAGT